VDLDPRRAEHRTRRGAHLQLLHGWREVDSVPMQAGMQDAFMTIATKTLVIFVAIVFVPFVAYVPAQADVTEADLIAASAGRTLRIGSVADGHVPVIPLAV